MRAPLKLIRMLRKADSNERLLQGDPRKRWLGFRYLNGGCETSAYRWGAYVVKRYTKSANPFPVQEAKEANVYPPQEWFVNGWVIQPFYRRFRWSGAMHRRFGTWAADFGSHNIGKDNRGRLVAFDW